MVQAKVLTVDKENEKFTLGIKQLADDPWLDVPNRFPVGILADRNHHQHHRLRPVC
jgi:small subunit ribosomal protein S1